ncbi:MAG: quinolinate phosphoribosyl transferase [Actinobacteria bacterium]|nr:quinolinate phosphoribosyl transferase [Actinomycetota bacterium]
MARRRLQPEIFGLPVEQIRRGFFTDVYFNRTRSVLEQNGLHPRVLMQVFQKKEAWLGGMDEAIACLKLASGGEDGQGKWISGWHQLEVRALFDGDRISPYETVMTIEGDYTLFAHLETVYLGSLARGTLVTKNVRAALDAARGKPVLMFGARHDHYSVQPLDGFAAHVAGIDQVSTDAQASFWQGKGIGTIPHSLIASYGGDTVAATRAFADIYYPEVNIVSLVDFDNDCVTTSLAVARDLGERLWGVRLDNSETLVDRSLWDDMGYFKPTGVQPELAFRVREALDAEGFQHVRIVVSAGFDAGRIDHFEAAGAPVDAYGVGSSLIRGENDYTADVVRLDGRLCAKAGRRYRPNDRLEPVE